jgi:hypothetical protein
LFSVHVQLGVRSLSMYLALSVLLHCLIRCLLYSHGYTVRKLC